MRAVLAIGFAAVLTAATAGDLYPFPMPWNDTGNGGITDLSSWNDKPAGAKGFVTVANGHLAAGGERIRFLGVNTTFGSNAPDRADADIIARRLARFGVNIVRIHHMDTADYPIGILNADKVTLNADYLDRLDYFIAALKRQGIYTDINLHVGRSYPGMGPAWPGGDLYFKGVDNFYDPMIALQKAYARDLLTHRNPYTGTRYAEEPSVAIVEINNENGLIYEWNTGHLDAMPDPFRSDLAARWQSWLRARYGNDAALRAAWGAHAEPLGAEMFTTGWELQTLGSAKATLTPNRTGLALKLDTKGQESWHVQMHQNRIAFDADRTYTLTLTVRADHKMRISVTAMQAHEPWKWLWQTDVKIGPEWKKLSFTIAPTEGESNARITLGGLGFETGTVEIAEASLKPGGVSGLSAEENLDRGTVALPEFANRQRHTPAAQRDWLAFLWDIEDGYWREMQRYLKADLGVKPLIVGTQINFSPAPVQAAMDVVDGHAYWAHPWFPNKPWDKSDWLFHNIPMAGISGGGTISELAQRRVPGKPYIVTEYNNPAPGFYQGEAMPLLGAYGALQDWDGLFLFDFGGWTNEWHTDHIEGFFDSRSNPVKMASLISTAAMLRRGDVAAAKNALGTMPDRAEFIEALRRSSIIPGGDSFGVPKETALARAVGATPSGGAAPVWPIKSETGELVWGLKNAGGKTVTIDTARTKALIGAKLGHVFDAHGVGLELKEARNDWGVITATVLQGKDFSSPARILVTTLGQEENTNQKWLNAEKTTIGNHWGHAPVLVEGLGARITLPVPAARVSAWALDERGIRKAEMAVTGTTRAVIDFTEGYRTPWYEIEIK